MNGAQVQLCLPLGVDGNPFTRARDSFDIPPKLGRVQVNHVSYIKRIGYAPSQYRLITRCRRTRRTTTDTVIECAGTRDVTRDHLRTFSWQDSALPLKYSHSSRCQCVRTLLKLPGPQGELERLAHALPTCAVFDMPRWITGVHRIIQTIRVCIDPGFAERTPDIRRIETHQQRVESSVAITQQIMLGKRLTDSSGISQAVSSGLLSSAAKGRIAVRGRRREQNGSLPIGC